MGMHVQAAGSVGDALSQDRERWHVWAAVAWCLALVGVRWVSLHSAGRGGWGALCTGLWLSVCLGVFCTPGCLLYAITGMLRTAHLSQTCRAAAYGSPCALLL